MPSAIRLAPEMIDVDALRQCAKAAGAEFFAPKVDSGEVLRFRLGNCFGCVSARKDGRLSIAGEAKRIYRTMVDDGNPAIRRSAEISVITLPADEHDKARAALAGAKTATVHTDGSCTGSGRGPGGWAAVINIGFSTVEIYGGAVSTTVNRMELIAAIAALKLLPPDCVVRVLTDSKYLKRGVRQWLDRWKENGWMTAAQTAVKNDDLWRTLDEVRTGRTITWKWVRGHNGDRGNERADALARQGRLSIGRTPR